MIAEELLSNVIPAINKNDSGSLALEWMDEFKVSHLPIVDNSEYLGLISDSEIYDLPNPDTSITSQQFVFARPFVRDNQHILEIMGLLSENNISVIPVLDVEDKYLGVITLPDLSNQVARLVSSYNLGAIIVLEMHVRDYSLSEIAQIVEGNDTKIMSLYVHNHNQPDHIFVTLKLNRTDISPVIQTFERYSYRIVQVYSNDKEFDSMLEDRYHSFMKFLSI